MNGEHPREPEHDFESDYDNASRASLDEGAAGPLDGDDHPPGRSDTGSTHAEADPTGNIGLSDYSVADDPDQG